MCVIAGRGVSLSKTVVYAAEAMKPGHGVVHVLGYENRVETTGKSVPNAMILPIPSAKPLGPENVIGSEGLKSVLDMYRKLLQPRGVTKGVSRSFGDSRPTVFDSGAYTIALASDAAGLREAVQMVPERKRPSFSDALLEGMAQAYPGWPIAICCFNDADFAAMSPDPLFWYYEPLDRTQLFAPALDAHDGEPPKPGVVARDHTVVFGSYKYENPWGAESRRHNYFPDVPEDKKWVVMRNFVGDTALLDGYNGDYVMDLVKLKHLCTLRYGDILTTANPPGWV